MGMRGRLSNVTANRQLPPDEVVITDEALAIYARMRRLEQECNCPENPETEEECVHWTRWWAENGRLAKMLGLFFWEFAYVDPRWEWPRTKSGEVERFHALEAAAAQAKRSKRFKYKWQK
jgi:hypothetical protein